MIRKNEVLQSVFASDAYSLSCHWVYDVAEIEKIGRTRELQKAHSQFHTKEKGELTHYGDHMLHLLQYLSEHKDFDQASYARAWQSFSLSYTGYKDHASKLAVKRLQHNAEDLVAETSRAVDLIAGLRFVPLLLLYKSKIAEVKTLAKQESSLSYSHPLIQECIDAFFVMLDRISSGTHPLEAARAFVSSEKGDLATMLAEGLQSAHLATQDAVQKFGSACGIDGGIQIIGHLLVKYPDDPVQALEENLFSGGDTAARAVGYTLLQSAYRGIEAIEYKWYEGLLAREQIDRAISTLAAQ